MTDLSCAVFLAVSKSIIYLAKMPNMMWGVNGLFVSSRKAVQTLKRL
jgi:hypothetical protein